MTYWIIFLILDGVCDAFLYNVKDPDKKNKPNEHFALWMRRAFVAFILFGLDVNLQIAAFLVSFFLHDTPYYLTRYLLDNTVYKNWFWTTSTTSTAISDKFLNATVRLLMFIAGLCYINTNISWIIVAGLLVAAFIKGIINTIKLRK